jgi:hypothetical protein
MNKIVYAVILAIALLTVINVQRANAYPDPNTTSLRVIDSMGGGSFRWAFPIVLGVVEDGQPIRLEGRFTSAGTFLLYAVEQIPGSCIDPDALFAFHEPQRPASALVGCAPFGLNHPQRDLALEHVTRWYNDGLTDWFTRTIADNGPSCGYTNVHGQQLAAFGYPICED